jgi:hypothetical protein
MSGKDYRAKLSAAQFRAIPVDEEYPIDGYYEALIDGNPKFIGIEKEYPRGYEDINLVRELTPGQRLLIVLGVFDGQVKNGGITQFFWNFPEFAFEARDALETLGETEVLANYDKALEAWLGAKDRCAELRREWMTATGDAPRWEAFRKSNEALDLSWFDDAYLDQWGDDARGDWVRLRPGLADRLLRRLAEYVRAHPAEFIEG